jgi:deoxyribose-phosphate aldolase
MQIMNNRDILSYVDHTQLKPYATWEDIQQLCEEAISYQTASVCVPPCYVKRIADTYGEKINICTVVGFPLGYSTTPAKVTEARTAVLDGASEIDMVVNITDVKNGDYNKVEEEIKALREAVGDKVLKVIIETCYLNEEEKAELCQVITKAKADFIKTSTGFGTGGATKEDVALMKEHVGSEVKIKAAGGIRSKKDMEDFISLGCERLGTSSAVDILTQREAFGMEG